MMNFLKDWIIQYQNKFSVGGVETTIDRITGTVLQEGDTIMASYLNEIQKNCIYQVKATRVVEGVLEIYDISIDGSEEFTPFNQTFLIDFSATNTKVDSLLRLNGKTYAIRKNYRLDTTQFQIGELQKRNFVVLDQTNSLAIVNEFNSNRNDVGVIKYVARNFLKANELKANGAAVLISAYQELANDIYCGDSLNATALFGYKCTNPSNPTGSRSVSGTHIVLPDLRGEFIRGWDDGRGLDSGRVLGSYQDDAIENHTHKVEGGVSIASANAGGFNYPIVSNTTAGISTLNTDATNIISGKTSTETRPKNIALMAIIKY